MKTITFLYRLVVIVALLTILFSLHKQHEFNELQLNFNEQVIKRFASMTDVKVPN